MLKSNQQSRRMRRLRSSVNLRRLLQQVHVLPEDLVMPLFICAGEEICNPVQSMPGCNQYSIDLLLPHIADLKSVGINAVILFGIPEYKDATGSAALDDAGVIQCAVKQIKQHYPDMLVITDLCMCEYTDHGHCGVLDAKQEVDNDATLELLAKQACSLADAGADIIAPSGMMDFMVQAIRAALDTAGHQNIAILSYAVKYASNCYGPFRDAAEGGMRFGDRKGYQMDYQNIDQAYLETALDVAEGADMLMIKPAQYYLDIIYRIKQQHPGVPLAAYQVSGEYSMIKAAAAAGYADEQAVMQESLIAIKRSGADFIISYFAYDYAKIWMERNGVQQN